MTAIPVEHYGWFSILPAALAIILAIKTRRVIESALCGIGLGAAIIDYHSNGFIHSVCYCIPNALMALAGHTATSTLKGIGLTKDPSRAQLFIGVLLLGAFIAVIEKSGGCQAFAQRSTKYIRGERGALLTCMAIGLSIFTSAFFGILVPGTAMNPFVTAGAVLSGGAFGDHCSPISDTAVLSSLAANTDHLEHIRTQLPYALVTAVFAFLGYIFLGYFISI